METFLLENEHIINNVYYKLMERSGPAHSMSYIYSLFYASIIGGCVYLTIQHMNPKRLADFISYDSISVFKPKPASAKSDPPPVAVAKTYPTIEPGSQITENPDSDGYISDFEY